MPTTRIFRLATNYISRILLATILVQNNSNSNCPKCSQLLFTTRLGIVFFQNASNYIFPNANNNNRPNSNIAETGAHVRREPYARAFGTPVQEAWLDIWACAGLRIQNLLRKFQSGSTLGNTLKTQTERERTYPRLFRGSACSLISKALSNVFLFWGFAK